MYNVDLENLYYEEIWEGYPAWDACKGESPGSNDIFGAVPGNDSAISKGRGFVSKRTLPDLWCRCGTERDSLDLSEVLPGCLLSGALCWRGRAAVAGTVGRTVPDYVRFFAGQIGGNGRGRIPSEVAPRPDGTNQRVLRSLHMEGRGTEALQGGTAGRHAGLCC